MSKFSKSKSEVDFDHMNPNISDIPINYKHKSYDFKQNKNLLKEKSDRKENDHLKFDYENLNFESNLDLVDDSTKINNKNKTNKVMPDTFNLNDFTMDKIKLTNLEEDETNEFDFVRKINKTEYECDNDYEANDLFVKLKVAEIHCAFFTIVSIGSGLVYNDLLYNGEKYESFANQKELLELSINFTIILVSIGVLLFVVASIFRYMIEIELRKATGEISKRYGFFNNKFFYYFLFEIILALLHPNFGFHQIKYTTDKTWYLMEVTYNLNDFFMIILLSRIYVIFRFLISINKYYDSRSSRVAKMIGNKLTRMFTVRCIIVVYPYTFLLISGTIIIITLAFMLKIIEGPIYDINLASQTSNNDFSSLENCVWNILVTMTTVGYGDYYPLTNLGRFINIIGSLIGTILVSLMIISLQNSLKFAFHEQKAYEDKEKLEIRRDIEEKAARFFKASFDYLVIRKKYKTALKSKNHSRSDLNELRKNVENVLYNRIEIKKDFKRSIQ